MSLKRKLLESLVYAASLAAPARKNAPPNPRSIFVLRNNDIGDLLVVTPLFEALKRRFPETKIVAGVGDWNVPVLENNPNVDEILPVNAPWHNLSCCRFPHNTLRGLLESVRFILMCPEVRALRERHFDVGIDILGSPEGSFLLMNAGIPHRLGVKGYAGGHTAAQQKLTFRFNEHVGLCALHFAERLGATELPVNRPQLFLTSEETAKAEAFWQGVAPTNSRRIVIGTGGGFREKCWPMEHYLELARLLAAQGDCQIAAVGGPKDRPAGAQIASVAPCIHDRTTNNGLRETFALVAQADLVICNSSMLMHVAAAFCKPAVVLLGEWFNSASQHADQWGYGELSQVCGKDASRTEIFTPAEVMERLRSDDWQRGVAAKTV